MLPTKALRFSSSGRLLIDATEVIVRPRARLSRVWIPTGGITAEKDESGHGKLVRAGFLRQSQSGIFQLLPLGLRVYDKLEKLVDKHMSSVGASKLSLSTFTTEELWRQSGRYDSVSPELFHLKDRKDAKLMLSPTHEEEITKLVTAELRSYKDLPIRVYQITRKYRDERRPRHGLLRSREFLMKDLYTYDRSLTNAMGTYKEVSEAYRNLFKELKMPLLVAEASSGDMGGSLSHEYHLSNPTGEDTVVNCSACGYTANDEVVSTRTPTVSETPEVSASEIQVYRGVSKDRKFLVNAWCPKAQGDDQGINLHAIKAAFPELDTTIERYALFWEKAMEGTSKPQVINLVDVRLVSSFQKIRNELPLLPPSLKHHKVEHLFMEEKESGTKLNVMSVRDGDQCPRCDTGKLKLQKALELGHTFHLGTRYTEPFGSTVSIPEEMELSETKRGQEVDEYVKDDKGRVILQMGCHGIGLSRIVGAAAEHFSDDQGLNWPRAIAPYEIAILYMPNGKDASLQLYDRLVDNPIHNFDVVLDDRQRSFGWKMKDAELTGYPVVLVLGKAWEKNGEVEVQCRRLNTKENISIERLPEVVDNLLKSL